MALGLNLVVGFAGLLDLGFVAFYAFGLMVSGWWASDFYSSVNNEEGIHIGVSEFASSLPGIHLNFLLLILGAILICAIAGAIIGLPTLRRGGLLAIVTIASEDHRRVCCQRRSLTSSVQPSSQRPPSSPSISNSRHRGVRQRRHEAYTGQCLTLASWAVRELPHARVPSRPGLIALWVRRGAGGQHGCRSSRQSCGYAAGGEFGGIAGTFSRAVLSRQRHKFIAASPLHPRGCHLGGSEIGGGDWGGRPQLVNYWLIPERLGGVGAA